MFTPPDFAVGLGKQLIAGKARHMHEGKRSLAGLKVRFLKRNEDLLCIQTRYREPR